MSIDATRWAWQQRIKRPAAKLVLLSLADRADEHHSAFPGIQRLLADTELDRKTIIDCIDYLERNGVISVERSIGKGNRYRLLGVVSRHSEHDPKTEPVPKTGPVPETGPVPKVGPVPKTGRDPSQKRDHTSPKNGTRIYQEPINNPLRGRSARGARLTHDLLPAEWRAWAEGEAPSLDADATFACFADHWRAQPGQKGVKADWFATWRNWIRREVKNNANATDRDRCQESRAERAARMQREAEQRAEQSYRAAGLD